MIVKFKNTGLLEEASVRLQGLTVIAGQNDTGKSTIGKLLFSIITTFNEKDTAVYLKPHIRSIIDDYFFIFRYRTGETSLPLSIVQVKKKPRL
ncbi:MAG TPA: hypothetical protein VK469_08355 [Candidatus Kapabacteria bacterium]|nr:hypothetical protein [Candidatus Kapabacteria bacterium]